jgi:hypothetical protein
MIWEVGVCGIWIRNGIVELGFGEFDFSINVSDSVESIFFLVLWIGFFNCCGSELMGSGSYDLVS